MCSRERRKSWIATSWQSWQICGDILVIFTKKGKLQWGTCWKESISLLWTCWDSDTGGDVQETVAIVSRTQQKDRSSGTSLASLCSYFLASLSPKMTICVLSLCKAKGLHLAHGSTHACLVYANSEKKSLPETYHFPFTVTNAVGHHFPVSVFQWWASHLQPQSTLFTQMKVRFQFSVSTYMELL